MSGCRAKERMQGAVSALGADQPPSPPETLLSEEREDVAVEKGARATEALKDPGDIAVLLRGRGREALDRKRMRNYKHPLRACHLSEHIGFLQLLVACLIRCFHAPSPLCKDTRQ